MWVIKLKLYGEARLQVVLFAMFKRIDLNQMQRVAFGTDLIKSVL